MPKRPSVEPRERPLGAVQPRAVEWLWPGWIPLGKVTVLDGDPGVGKSTLLLDLAARLSRDGVLPDGARVPAAASVILSAEDGEADTIRPRLAAAGGDPDRVFSLAAVEDDDGEDRPPELPLDLPAVEGAVIRRGARLLVIDPLLAFLTGVDAGRDQQVRRALRQLARAAERRGCAVVCLRHLSRIGGDRAVYRGAGSIGIIATARSALLAAADPDDPTLRVLAATKCNLGPAPRPLCYRLEPKDGVCRVQWLGEADYTPDELVRRLSRSEQAKRAEERTRLQEAVEFLREQLADGPMQASAGFLLAHIEGIAKRTVQRALKAAGVRTYRRKGQTDYTWELDPSGQQPTT
jgi:RecA-family ATPase